MARITTFFNRRHAGIGVDVTAGCAIAIIQFLDGIGRIRIFMFLMRPGFVISRVTTRAIRLVACKLICLGFRIGEVAVSAQEISPVLRIIPGMVIESRIPVVC